MSGLGDGNKESAKEILSTYRTLFAIDVSGMFVLINLYILDKVHIREPLPFWIGIALWVLSATAMVWLFFLVVPKLYYEEQEIIYQRSVFTTSMIGFWFFVLGYIAIVVGVTS